MMNHVKSHEDALQPEKQYLPEDLLVSIKEDGSVSYHGVEIKIDSVCLVCGKVYRNKDNKRRHEEYYRDKKTHSRKTGKEHNYNKTDSFCFPCDKDFCNNQSKRNHELKKHPEMGTGPTVKGPENVKCILDCTKTFGNKEELEKHMEVGDHNGIFFFTCSKCPKKFGSTADMKKHMMYFHEGRRDVKEEIRRTQTDEVKVFDLVPSVKSSIKNEEVFLKEDVLPNHSLELESQINHVVDSKSDFNLEKENAIIENESKENISDEEV